MIPTTNASSFGGMNNPNMTPQHQQRMQPPPVSTPNSSQRVSPYGGGPQHITPPHGHQQSQFVTPQNPNHNPNLQQQNAPSQIMTQGQHQPQSANQAQPQSAGTPQTPSFPTNPGSASGHGQALATPLSPGSESREKARVSLLLDINRELLMEVMELQKIQAEVKKESAADGDKAAVNGEEKKVEKEKPIAVATGKNYMECVLSVFHSCLP